MKICVIGGGSFTWTFGFVRQFVLSKNLVEVTLTLMDVERPALDLVHTAASIFNQQHGSPIALESTTSLTEALDGADFVLVTITTGGLAAMAHDLQIPEKYGIWQTVGDTVGPGGLCRAVRNIPIFHELAGLMKERCPNAWLINLTNPLTVLTRVPERDFNIKTIGMCPAVEETARALIALAGLDAKARIDYSVTGVDHGSYFTSLKAGGTDVLLRLRELGFYRSDDLLPSASHTEDPLAATASNRAIFALWRELGYLPSISDRHAVENHPWFVVNPHGELAFGIKRTNVQERQAWRDRNQLRLEKYIQTKDLTDLADQGHGNDPVLEVIEALCGFRSFVWGSNYKNIGQIPELPRGAVVETRCLFDSAAVHPLCSPMPQNLQAIVLPHVLRQEAIIDIALQGSFDEFVGVVISDPLCSQLKINECRTMLREMLTANQAWIRNRRLLAF